MMLFHAVIVTTAAYIYKQRTPSDAVASVSFRTLTRLTRDESHLQTIDQLIGGGGGVGVHGHHIPEGAGQTP